MSPKARTRALTLVAARKGARPRAASAAAGMGAVAQIDAVQNEMGAAGEGDGQGQLDVPFPVPHAEPAGAAAAQGAAAVAEAATAQLVATAVSQPVNVQHDELMATGEDQDSPAEVGAAPEYDLQSSPGRLHALARAARAVADRQPPIAVAGHSGIGCDELDPGWLTARRGASEGSGLRVALEAGGSPVLPAQDMAVEAAGGGGCDTGWFTARRGATEGSKLHAMPEAGGASGWPVNNSTAVDDFLLDEPAPALRERDTREECAPVLTEVVAVFNKTPLVVAHTFPDGAVGLDVSGLRKHSILPQLKRLPADDENGRKLRLRVNMRLERGTGSFVAPQLLATPLGLLMWLRQPHVGGFDYHTMQEKDARSLMTCVFRLLAWLASKIHGANRAAAGLSSTAGGSASVGHRIVAPPGAHTRGPGTACFATDARRAMVDFRPQLTGMLDAASPPGCISVAAFKAAVETHPGMSQLASFWMAAFGNNNKTRDRKEPERQAVRNWTGFRTFVDAALHLRSQKYRGSLMVNALCMELWGASHKARQLAARLGVACSTSAGLNFKKELLQKEADTVQEKLRSGNCLAVCFYDNFVRISGVTTADDKCGAYHGQQLTTMALRIVRLPQGLDLSLAATCGEALPSLSQLPLDEKGQPVIMEQVDFLFFSAFCKQHDEKVLDNAHAMYELSYTRKVRTLNCTVANADKPDWFQGRAGGAAAAGGSGDEIGSIRKGLYDDDTHDATDGMDSLHGTGATRVNPSNPERIGIVRGIALGKLGVFADEHYVAEVTDIGIHGTARRLNQRPNIINFMDQFHVTLKSLEAFADVFHTPILEPLMRDLLNWDAKPLYRSTRTDQIVHVINLLQYAYEPTDGNVRGCLLAAMRSDAAAWTLPDSGWRPRTVQLRVLWDMFEYFIPTILTLPFLQHLAAEAEASGDHETVGLIFDILKSDTLPQLAIIFGHWKRWNYQRHIWTELAAFRRGERTNHPMLRALRLMLPRFSQRGLELFHRVISEGVARSNFRAEADVIDERLRLIAPARHFLRAATEVHGLSDRSKDARTCVQDRYPVMAQKTVTWLVLRIKKVLASTMFRITEGPTYVFDDGLGAITVAHVAPVDSAKAFADCIKRANDRAAKPAEEPGSDDEGADVGNAAGMDVRGADRRGKRGPAADGKPNNKRLAGYHQQCSTPGWGTGEGADPGVGAGTGADAGVGVGAGLGAGMGAGTSSGLGGGLGSGSGMGTGPGSGIGPGGGTGAGGNKGSSEGSGMDIGNPDVLEEASDTDVEMGDCLDTLLMTVVGGAEGAAAGERLAEDKDEDAQAFKGVLFAWEDITEEPESELEDDSEDGVEIVEEPYGGMATLILERALAAHADAYKLVFKPGGNPDQVLYRFDVADCWYAIKRSHLQSLAHGAWLDDEVINFTVLLLLARDARLRGGPSASGGLVPPRCHFFSTHFYVLLQAGGWRRVQKWTSQRSLARCGQASPCVLDVDFIIVPVHLGRHWVCVQLDLNARKLHYYDSLGGWRSTVVNKLLEWVVEEARARSPGPHRRWKREDWAAVPHTEPRQRNGYDCGMFAVLYAERVSAGRPLDFTQDLMQDERVRLTGCLLAGRIN